MTSQTRRPLALLVCTSALLLGLHAPASLAQSTASQEASALSVLPVALSVAVPVILLVNGAVLTVRAVEASGEGSAWVLERASDGARASIRFTGRASAAVGTAITVTAIGSGYLLTAAGQAIAFIPNAVGEALLHNERVTR